MCLDLSNGKQRIFNSISKNIVLEGKIYEDSHRMYRDCAIGVKEPAITQINTGVAIHNELYYSTSSS